MMIDNTPKVNEEIDLLFVVSNSISPMNLK
jgi:hypothetical protein